MKFLLCVFVSILILADMTWGECTFPTDIQTDLDSSHLVGKIRNSYSQDDFVLFSCKEVKGGFGHVKMDCQSDDEWSEPDRACSDEMIPGIASYLGVVCFLLPTVFVIIVIIITREKPAKSDGSLN